MTAAAAGLDVNERSSVSKQELKWNGAGGLGKKRLPANGPAATTRVPGTVTGINALIQKLMLGSSEDDPEIPEGWSTPSFGDFKEGCYANSRFPVQSTSIVRMQTPAFNDNFRSDCG